jgi:hypothetical protein
MKQLKPADDTSIVEVFERLNTGGMSLRGQEVRNCIFAGEFNELLKRLNKNDHWRLIVGKKTEDSRMRDVELILRFLALYHNFKSYKKPMKLFLNDFMRTYRRQRSMPGPDDSVAKKNAIAAEQRAFGAKLQAFEKLFADTAKSVHTFLGPRPFHIKRGLNAAVFDSVFVAFAQNLDRVRLAKPTLSQTNHLSLRFKQLCDDENYKKYTTSATTDDEVVKDRLTKAAKILFG